MQVSSKWLFTILTPHWALVVYVSEHSKGSLFVLVDDAGRSLVGKLVRKTRSQIVITMKRNRITDEIRKGYEWYRAW